MGWFVLLVWFVAWVGTPIVASNRHRSVWGWLVLGIFFGLFAFVTILLLPALPDFKAQQEEWATMRTCPHCLSRIPKAASVCRYCQRDVAPFQTTSAPRTIGTFTVAETEAAFRMSAGHPSACPCTACFIARRAGVNLPPP